MTARRKNTGAATATEAAPDTATGTPKGKKSATAYPRTHEGISELRPVGDGTAREVMLVDANGQYPADALEHKK